MNLGSENSFVMRENRHFHVVVLLDGKEMYKKRLMHAPVRAPRAYIVWREVYISLVVK